MNAETEPVIWNVEHVDEVGSTNAEAASRASAGLVVVAEHQTGGRGRLDRSWETPRGKALTFSAVVPVPADQRSWPLLPLAAGLAVARALGPEASLKWPNDVLIGENKVCGVLVELTGGFAVVGIGVNLSQTREELPVASATSLALAGIDADRDELLAAILAELGQLLRVIATSYGDLLAEYRTRCATLGRPVRVMLPADQTLVGQAEGIDTSGRLEVATARGMVAVSAGDVIHVRPAG